jgi:hypothetical protein
LAQEAGVTSAETELEMVRRHLSEGEAIIDRQTILISELSEAGKDSKEAQAVLSTFLITQSLHREHLARLMVWIAD